MSRSKSRHRDGAGPFRFSRGASAARGTAGPRRPASARDNEAKAGAGRDDFLDGGLARFPSDLGEEVTV